MAQDYEVVEKNIEELRPLGFFEKHDIKFTVAELEEVPYSDFEVLQRDLRSGQAIARTSPFGAGVSSAVLSLFASPSQKRFITMLTLSSFAAAAMGIGLTIFADSWWWLPLVLAPFIAIKRAKSIYSEALFSAIGASEKAFSFAFCGNIITLETADGMIHARGRATLCPGGISNRSLFLSL